MRQILFFAGVAVALLGLSATPSHGREREIAKADARTWLKKIQTAGDHLGYSGVFIYQQGNQIRTSRITHVADRQGEIEKLEILDGAPREYIRSNDNVVYYMPEAKTLLVEKGVTQEIFPALLAAGPSALAEHYALRTAGTARIAGFECQEVILEPKDELRYGYRLWAEKESGLLLRAQTVNEKGSVIEQISFTQIAIGNIDRSRVEPGVSDIRGWRVENAVLSQGHLTGWTINDVPPGFRKIREVRRLLSDTGNGSAAGAGQREVSQIVYSDGLAAISIFIEPGTQSRTEGSVQQGAMNIVGKRYGDFWLTIVGEVPPAAVRQVANSVEFKSR